MTTSTVKTETNLIEGITKIRLRRGSSVSIPPANQVTAGEPKFAMDTGDLYVDDGTKNVLVGGKTVFDAFDAKLGAVNEKLNDRVAEEVVKLNESIDAVNARVDETHVEVTNVAVAVHDDIDAKVSKAYLGPVVKDVKVLKGEGSKELLFKKTVIDPTKPIGEDVETFDAKITSGDGSVSFRVFPSFGNDNVLDVSVPGLALEEARAVATERKLADAIRHNAPRNLVRESGNGKKQVLTAIVPVQDVSGELVLRAFASEVECGEELQDDLKVVVSDGLEVDLFETGIKLSAKAALEAVKQERARAVAAEKEIMEQFPSAPDVPGSYALKCVVQDEHACIVKSYYWIKE